MSRLFRPQTIIITRIRYRRLSQYVNFLPTIPIMADSPSFKSSLPQTRVLPDSEVDEPAHKKPRLDDDYGKEANVVDSDMGDPIASTSQPTINNGSEKRSKKKNKKRREVPLPELCSAGDVLYKEIRSMLGGDVVDAVTSEGGAFKSPYSRGDEVEVTIDRITAGGKFKISSMWRAFDLTCTSLGSGIGLVSKDKGPWTIVVPFALPGEKARVRIGKNDRMHSTGEVLELLTHNPDLRDDSRIKCKYFGTCAGCQYQVIFSPQSTFFFTRWNFLLIYFRCCLPKLSWI